VGGRVHPREAIVALGVSARRWVAVLVAAGAAVSIGMGAAADEAAPHRPGIHFGAATPDDLRSLASATWDRFLDAFPARWDCVADVTLRGAWQSPDRGAYDPRRRLVTVRIPGTAPNLRATMVHEFAHHLEYTCPAQRRLRARFLAAQGFPPGTPWRHAAAWALIPAEQYAQAAIRVVLGQAPDPPTRIRPAALRAIRSWGLGR
jgi:hypothetical protein